MQLRVVVYSLLGVLAAVWGALFWSAPRPTRNAATPAPMEQPRADLAPLFIGASSRFRTYTYATPDHRASIFDRAALPEHVETFAQRILRDGDGVGVLSAWRYENAADSAWAFDELAAVARYETATGSIAKPVDVGDIGVLGKGSSTYDLTFVRGCVVVYMRVRAQSTTDVIDYARHLDSVLEPMACAP